MELNTEIKISTDPIFNKISKVVPEIEWKVHAPLIHKINKKSETEQIKQTRKINSLFSPCSITKIFCGPKARIKLIPVIKPNII